MLNNDFTVLANLSYSETTTVPVALGPVDAPANEVDIAGLGVAAQDVRDLADAAVRAVEVLHQRANFSYGCNDTLTMNSLAGAGGVEYFITPRLSVEDFRSGVAVTFYF